MPSINSMTSESPSLAIGHAGGWGLSSLMVVLALSIGCVPNRMHREQSVVEKVNHEIAFIEFDDQGELWSGRQLLRAVDTVRTASRSKDGAIVFVFVHGWNHSAAVGDSNTMGFESILEEIVRSEQARTDGPPRPVVGVYLGWRGKNVRFSALRPFSFFNRRSTAQRIAGTAATETVYRLAKAAKENAASKVVLLGHSFGGLILESAVTQAMVGSVIVTKGESEVFPADAVILINPASQSIRAKAFIEALERDNVTLYRRDSNGHEFERPLIISVTSETDRATGLLFPIGLSLRGLNKNFRTYESDHCTPVGRQKAFYRSTAGHNAVMASHTITAGALDIDSTGTTSTSELASAFGQVTATYDPRTQDTAISFAGTNRPFTIKRRPRAQNHSPYWIVQVPKELIPDHSDIFGVDTVRLLGALLAMTGALEHDSQAEIVYDRRVRPIALVEHSSGEFIVLDRNRRIYMIDSDGQARSPGCIPQVVDAADRIGLEFDEQGGYTVINRLARTGKHRKFHTEILRLRLSASGPQILQRVRVPGIREFTIATFDFDHRRVFLASTEPGVIYVAPLDKATSNEPTLFAQIDGMGPLVALAFDPVSDRVYATDSVSGSLAATESNGDGIADSRIVATTLGLPISLDTHGAAGLVYTLDAQGATIFRMHCQQDIATCGEPEVFATQPVRHPSLIQVGRDGTVWVGGPGDVVPIDASGTQGSSIAF